MHTISKYLWGSLLLLCAIVLAAWWALQQGGGKLPSQVLEQIGSHIEKNTPDIQMPDIAAALPDVSIPDVGIPEVSLPEVISPLPNTLTYYRWTDRNGNTGYSKVLPEQVSSYETIVLNGE